MARLAFVARLHGDHDIDLHTTRAVDRDIADRRELGLELAQDRGLEGDLLQDVILGDRLAGQQALEDRALAVGDRGDLGDRFERGRRVVAGVLAERALDLLVIGIDRELDHDLGVSRHLHVVADRLGELYRRTAQAASHEPVVGGIARLHLAGKHRQWIDADHQRAVELLSHLGGMGDVLAEAMVGGGRRRAPSARGPASDSCRCRECRSRDFRTRRCPR